MARRQRDRLSVKFIESATREKSPKPGMHADGSGLYLSVAESGAASWMFRYKVDKRPRMMGLGSLDRVTLKEAREKAEDARRKMDAGIDPLDERRSAQIDAKLSRAKTMTFKQCAEAYIDAHQAGWRNAKHARQWPSSLSAHVYPIIGDLPVQSIDTALVMRVIEPLWKDKTETASRLRGRIESVLDWARTREYRSGANPARWRGHLENLLPATTKVAPVEHHDALPYGQMAGFIAALRQQESVAASALEFMILSATRTSETRLARWDEIDIANRLWTIPAERMKAHKEHRVPLTDRAMEIVEKMAEIRQDNFVFPGSQGSAVAVNGMLLLAKKIAGNGVTAHGFRSTFRDWAAERSSFPAEVAEMALGHTVGAAVERAYRRGDMFEKRRQLADAWARYCAASQAEGRVVPIRGAAAK